MVEQDYEKDLQDAAKWFCEHEITATNYNDGDLEDGKMEK